MILTTPFGKFEGTIEECIRVARVLADTQEQQPAEALDLLQRSLDRLYERARERPKIMALSDREYERLGRLIAGGVGTYSKLSRYKFQGIEIVGHLGVEPGVVVALDENYKVVGAFAWSPK